MDAPEPPDSNFTYVCLGSHQKFPNGSLTTTTNQHNSTSKPTHNQDLQQKLRLEGAKRLRLERVRTPEIDDSYFQAVFSETQGSEKADVGAEIAPQGTTNYKKSSKLATPKNEERV